MIRFSSFVAPALLAGLFIAGCGSDGGAASTPPATTDTDSSPYNDAWRIAKGFAPTKSWTPGSANPCSIKSGYLGDDLCILPPDPSIGFQIHYGPSNYTDQAEVDKFILQPGGEVTDCMFLASPNAEEVYWAEYHGRMRPGSHHMLVYTQDGVLTPSDGPVNCNQGVTTRNIFGSQTAEIDFINGIEGAPENQGMGQRLPPDKQVIMQMHFINTTQVPILREAWANIVFEDPSKVTQVADPIFFLGGTTMAVPPGSTQVIKGSATAGQDLRLVSATGHFHAHTVRFSAWKTIAGDRQPLFEDFNWHEPSFISFNSATKNALSDPAARTFGGYSGIVQLAQGDLIDWECEVVNDSPGTLRFGNAVESAEMCNMFGVYSPGNDAPWRAVN